MSKVPVNSKAGRKIVGLITEENKQAPVEEAQAMCGHSRVTRVTQTSTIGLTSEWWQCEDCPQMFSPAPPEKPTRGSELKGMTMQEAAAVGIHGPLCPRCSRLMWSYIAPCQNGCYAEPPATPSEAAMPSDRQPTLEELRSVLPVVRQKRRGLYAAAPGTGPEGKTCHDCAHLRYMRYPKHPKCGLTKYTHGDATTIRTRTPACSRYEADE